MEKCRLSFCVVCFIVQHGAEEREYQKNWRLHENFQSSRNGDGYYEQVCQSRLPFWAEIVRWVICKTLQEWYENFSETGCHGSRLEWDIISLKRCSKDLRKPHVVRRPYFGSYTAGCGCGTFWQAVVVAWFAWWMTVEWGTVRLCNACKYFWIIRRRRCEAQCWLYILWMSSCSTFPSSTGKRLLIIRICW